MTVINKKKETSSISNSQILMKWLEHHQDQILSAEADQRSESTSPFLPIDHHFVGPIHSTSSSGTGAGGKSARKHLLHPSAWKTLFARPLKNRIKLQEVWAKFF